MAMFKDFTFDGENSKDYGVYISGDAVYDAPERAMEMVQIPGRNGALALDNGYYNNIDVTYPAGCFADDQADFAAKLSRIRNMLASRHRYCRLEDAYHPDHFRMALYKSGLDVAPVARNKAGRFNITFDAKPQRFMKSGEVVQELDADAPPTTSYGPADIVSFEGEPGDVIVHGQWPLEPIQDLHGYDSPWPAGGGKNLVDDSAIEQGTITPSEPALSSTRCRTAWDKPIPVTAGEAYAISGSAMNGTFNCFVGVYADSSTMTRLVGSGWLTSGSSYTIPAGGNYVRLTFRVDTDAYVTPLNFKNVQFEKGSTATAFAPYSNICPITGFTGSEITDRGVNLWDEEVEDGYIDGAGNLLPYEKAIRSKNYCPIRPNLTYCYVRPAGMTGFSICWYNVNHTFISRVVNTTVFTAPSNAMFFKFSLYNYKDYSPTYNHDVGLNYPSTDTAYHASVGTTHEVSWSDEAGTVYGGTLEYLGGDSWRLTKEWELLVLDGTETWTASSAQNVFGITAGTNPRLALYRFKVYGNPISYNGSLYCSHFKGTPYEPPDTAQNNTATSYSGASGSSIRIKSAMFSDVSAVSAFTLSEHNANTPVCFALPLITPVSYDLTGEELQALIGTNNIFSDTGTTTITVQSPYELENPTLYPSKPLIRVYGSGTIHVNDITITVAEHSGYIDIDCDMMDCHRGADSMNQYVSFSGNDFPELQPGTNRILLNGPDKVEITPRWWEL